MTSIDVPGRVAADNDRAARVDLDVRAVRRSHQVSRARHVAAAYLGLTKPRIIELLLVTTVPAMFLAAGGVPPLKVVLLTMVGGCLAAASANAFNCVLDRDIDERMRRTRRRPLPRHAVGPFGATVFGMILAIAATLWLGYLVNWLSAALAVGANAFYVGVYTLWLKRRTPQNIIWGGIAGCFPVVIGWAAVTGSLSWAPIILFAVVFLWTPPHYWPLSRKYRSDYQAVGVPMLAVVRGRAQVGLQVILYAWATVVCSLLLIPVADMGLLYSAVALLSGGWFVYETHRLYNLAIRHEHVSPMRVFHGSITYLTLLFLAVGIDPLLPF